MNKCDLCGEEFSKGYINLLDRRLLCEKCRDEYDDSWEWFDDEDEED